VPGFFALWVMDADGSRQRELAPSVSPLWFRWSPDGKQIGLVSGLTIGLGSTSGIFLLDVDGGRLRAMSPNCDDAGTCSAPGARGLTWAPDASRIAFVQDGRVLLATRSGARTTVPVDLSCCLAPDTLAFSPDGAALAFAALNVAYASDPFPRRRVGVVPITGGVPALVPPADSSLFSPAWRP
jgi:Tol biopolymer transport system component